MPKVLNKHRDVIPPDAINCMRGTPHGNPFRIGAQWIDPVDCQRKKMDRETVCDRFEREVLPHRDVSMLRGRDLVCVCAPLRCHCDAILRKANR